MINTPKYLIIHHTGGTNVNPLADTSHHTFAGIHAYHKSKGWESCGYHYVIEKGGKLVENKYRKENYHGAHAKGYNTKSIGICLSGNFDTTLPTSSQISTLRTLLNKLVGKYDIELKNVIPHRSVASKTCYGRKLTDDWARNLIKKEDNCLKLSTVSQLVKELLSRF